jgi:hypothetical protein
MDLQDARKRQFELFTEHLPYELTMLDAATQFISAEVEDDPLRLGWFRAQSAIEAFWVHARLLIEFFTNRSRTPNLTRDPNDFVPDTQVYHASALDFAKDFKSQIKADELIKTKINPQIVHFNYQRETDPLKKLGFQIFYIKPQIDTDVGNFVDALDEQWRKVWKECEWWQRRSPVTEPAVLVDRAVSTSSVYQTWVSNIDPNLQKARDFELKIADGE